MLAFKCATGRLPVTEHYWICSRKLVAYWLNASSDICANVLVLLMLIYNHCIYTMYLLDIYFVVMFITLPTTLKNVNCNRG